MLRYEIQAIGFSVGYICGQRSFFEEFMHTSKRLFKRLLRFRHEKR